MNLPIGVASAQVWPSERQIDAKLSSACGSRFERVVRCDHLTECSARIYDSRYMPNRSVHTICQAREGVYCGKSCSRV